MKRAHRSVVLLLQSMLGMDVKIELKTEYTLEGRVEEVGEGNMDVRLTGVKQTSPQGAIVHLDEVFVMGKMILFVHLPDRLNVAAHLRDYMHLVDKNKNLYQRSTRKPPTKPLVATSRA
ncbi:hypothetical protein H310_00474 [Aphanomyces invadans]|uniref:Sm domain-containing protein n=1 Tax=Aphanomyces invadans TaxID=157072 RepID=A0A024UUS1_9STRA|nr:hypothetical protein H310_00474 [Aphanomyces invadans]ETW10089.1 hypothetical protein H310_00474 [Aphanomyces invadans]|eukprot:XP_008861500.1 hypothetical protein H310_00474 [Aphanomyces invadans]